MPYGIRWLNYTSWEIEKLKFLICMNLTSKSTIGKQTVRRCTDANFTNRGRQNLKTSLSKNQYTFTDYCNKYSIPLFS